MTELENELTRLGAREFELPLFSLDPDRGWAALRTALKANVDNPIRYATKLIEDPQFRPRVAGQASNLAAVVECKRCDGDRFVVVASRPPVQTEWMRERGIEPNLEHKIEEYGPCPACNAG